MDERPRERREIRLSNAERDVVIAQLTEAMNDGRITLLEFEERSGLVYASQYPSQLAPITADLPATAEQVVQPTPPPANSAPKTTDTKPSWAVQVLSGNERRGNWNPGSVTKAISVLAEQTLDLTEIDADVVNIKATSVMGTIEIIVPDGADVDLDGFILLGGTSNNGLAPSAGPSTMTVHIRAYGLFGSCKVRNLKRRERKKRGLPPQ